MPKKIAPNRNRGEKLIRLFAALIFSGRPKSLIELSRELKCSKQTVSRLVDDITLSESVMIESFDIGRRRYYNIQTPKITRKGLKVSREELAVLHMCQSFTKHLLGQKLFENATRGIGKTRLFLSDGESIGTDRFADFLPGSIDYTPHSPSILTIVEAMDNLRICRIRYRRLMAENAKEFFIKPLKLFSHKETLYLHAKMARIPGKPHREPDFDPLLPVHRIEKISLTDRRYKYPVKYDFEKVYNQSFGVIKDKAFTVELNLSGWAAAYARERIWSPDQKISKTKDGGLRLQFSASSRKETISSVMSLGPEATVVRPEWLRKKISDRAMAVARNYE